MINSSTHNIWRMLLFSAFLLIYPLNVAAASEQSPDTEQKWEAAPGDGRPDWGKVDWDGWERVEDLLNNIREVSGIPAIAAAIVKDGSIIDFATVGVRQFGTLKKVGIDDRFHIGSVTKSMTATLIGKLVEEGFINWGTTVESVLPDIPMRKEYRTVTVAQLLHHQGGIQSYSSDESYRKLARQRYSGTPTEQRAAFLAAVLQLEPAGIPGEITLYANAGYALTGHMAERLTGKSWEELIEQYIFEPLGMTNSGFGHPGTASVPNQPRGHGIAGTEFVPLFDDEHPSMDIIAPAGNVHCSVRDLAQYAISHINGLNGQDGYLLSETIKRLHTLPSSVGVQKYASGWIIQSNPNGETIHRHGGTTGSFYAELKLYPERNAGVVIIMNVGQTAGELVVNKVGRSLMSRYSPEEQSAIANLQTGQGQLQFKMGNPNIGNFTFKKQGNIDKTEALELTYDETATPENDARTWSVLKSLAEAFNNEDKQAFLNLFSEQKRSQQEGIFKFMARQILPTRGGVQSFHDISRAIKIPDTKFPLQTVTFHLENGYPGYFGISLDDEGKIDHFSLFVKPDLCPNGPDTQCDLVARTLGKDFGP